MPNQFISKHSLVNNTPSNLETGELAYSYPSNDLFIGNAAGKNRPAVSMLSPLKSTIADLAATKAALAGNNAFTGSNSFSKLALPNALRVQANQNVEQSIVAGAAAVKVLFQSITFNGFTEFANSRFTAKEAGLHFFYGNVYFNNSTVLTNWRLNLRANLNGVAYKILYEDTATASLRGTPIHFQAPLAVNNHIEIFVFSSLGCLTSIGASNTFFEVTRVG